MNNTNRPYFIWDYDLTGADVKKIIRGENEIERRWMIAKIITSAKYEDIWKYLTVKDVVAEFPNLRLRPGIKLAWQRALNAWGHHV